MLLPPATAAASRIPRGKFSSYQDFRKEFLQASGRCQQALWLVSKRITDPEVSTALALAKYRQLNVAVLVHAGYRGAPGDQSGLLAQAGVRVGTYQPRFFHHWPLAWLCDREVALATSDLTVPSQRRPVQVQAGGRSLSGQEFVGLFRGFYQGSVQQGPLVPPSSFAPTVASDSGAGFRSYQYEGQQRRRPQAGQVRQLPRVPKWQQKKT